ncbi:hypothetical protein Tco_0774733 [Tanacetum coccineum]|uniref:DUF4201 domain-containing protein n=1 Tax=Tanacetum coccineum TaxID=301880 RepID=A0ABQ4ZT37_9ASTR
MLEVYITAVDPLALMSNVSPQHYHSQSSTIPPTTYHQPLSADTSQSDLGLSPTDNIIREPTKHLPYSPSHTKPSFLKQTINSELHQTQGIKLQYKTAGLLFRMFRVDRTEDRNSEYFKDKMLLMQAQENRVVLDEEQLLFLAADDCDAYDSDVDEAPMAQTMFMANLSSADPVYDEVGPSYDSDILSEEQVELYERRARFELTEREQKIDEQLRIVICDHNIKEENLKKELHSVKLQLASTIQHNKLMMKAEALKEQNTRPIKALTVYPPNTPATLVPRVLPTKSQVKINIFTLRQLFSEFEKTCKKRITPTGITEGERGFEQTKTCYLTELEAELDQSIVDRKHDEIERKNLLIEHDNIIADGLSKEVFYVASNSELNVSRFTEMQKAHNVVKARCLELEAELSNLRDNIHKDNYNELLNRFSNLEVNHLNLQLKYQNLKDSFQNKPSSPVNDTPDFNSVFVIGQMKASLQGKDNVIQKLKMQISHLKETRSELDLTRDFRALDFQISQLTEKVNVLQEQNELFRAENAKIKQHYKELYDSIKITRAKHLEQITALKMKMRV